MRYFIAVIMSLSTISIVHADTIVKRNKNLDGGIITDRPNSNRLPTPEFIPPAKPSFTLPPAKDIIPNSQTSRVKIQLNGVQFEGNEAVDTKTLQELAKPYIGKAVLITELEDLRQKISQYYSGQGYVNSGAIIPEQNFSNGIIKLQIIEGKLTEIRVNGTEWLSPSYVSGRLALEQSKALNVNVLREHFQQLLLDPLIERMNGSLLPSNARGSSILNVDVVRARPYNVSFTADNYRPPSVGSKEGKLSGWARNITGFGDIIDGTFIFSGGTLAGSGGFSVPLNAHDTRFNFHFDLSQASVIEESLKSAQIRSQYNGFEFGLIQPLWQSLNRNLNVGVLFNVKENKTTVLDAGYAVLAGASPDGVTRDSALRFSLDFTERRERQVFSARSTTSLGVNAFGASWSKNASMPDSNFVSWLGQAQYAGQLFQQRGTLILRGDMQYTEDKLLSLERFAVGGRYSVRGYRENTMVRDRGYILSAEYRHPLFTDNSSEHFGQVTLFPFMDYGAGWNRGANNKTDYLHSVGIGIEWQPFKELTSELIYAYAINKVQHPTDFDLQDSGVHWKVTLSAF
ncbi:MAG: ShlB/FhaC/HecB family hemolysin secretion/activation protein [Methylococcaceae bacterium]